MYSARRAKVSADASKAMGTRAVAFLRHLYPAKTAEAVSADVGLPVSTVAKWIEGVAVPGDFALFRLGCVYGPEFLCALTDSPPPWLDRAYREERQRKLDEKIAALQAERARLEAAE